MGRAKRRWISERKRDVYHRKAKELGYRSRAAFKLIEICRRTGLIRPGDAVLDLLLERFKKIRRLSIISP